MLSNKITFINYVKLKENIADLLTKGLSRELAYNSLRRIGLKPLKDKKKSVMMIIIQLIGDPKI